MDTDFSSVSFYTRSGRNEEEGSASEERNTVYVARNNANDKQERTCEKRCLFSALNNHNAARSLRRKMEKYDE